jgi:hypothetical protein
MAKSTPYFRVLRDAGLIRTTKRGVKNLNNVRWHVNERTFALIYSIHQYALDTQFARPHGMEELCQG